MNIMNYLKIKYPQYFSIKEYNFWKITHFILFRNDG